MLTQEKMNVRRIWKNKQDKFNEVLEMILEFEERDPTHFENIKKAYYDSIGECEATIISYEAHIIAKFLRCCEFEDSIAVCKNNLEKIKEVLK